MANFICTKIYFLCLTILCIRAENSLSFETKTENILPFQSVLLQKLLQDKLPFLRSKSTGSIYGSNFPSYKEIGHDSEFPKMDSIIQQNLPFLKNNQRENGFDFSLSGSVFSENLPFQKNNKFEQPLDFPAIDSKFSDHVSSQKNDKPDEDEELDSQESEDGTFNYVYFVQVTPNVSVRSIIVANISCKSGYRKDKRGKCRKML